MPFTKYWTKSVPASEVRLGDRVVYEVDGRAYDVLTIDPVLDNGIRVRLGLSDQKYRYAALTDKITIVGIAQVGF